MIHGDGTRNGLLVSSENVSPDKFRIKPGVTEALSLYLSLRLFWTKNSHERLLFKDDKCNHFITYFFIMLFDREYVCCSGDPSE